MSITQTWECTRGPDFQKKKFHLFHLFSFLINSFFMDMFIRGLLPENVLSVLHQLSSFPPRILSVLQLSKNIRALISLLCGCVCKNVLRRVFFYIRQHLFVGACPCKYRRLPISVCQHALIQYSNAPMVLLHLGNIKSFSITASPCFTNCSGLHRLRTELNHQTRKASLLSCRVNALCDSSPLQSLIFNA